ncbi:hypothetical protein C9439_04820 [archaeon SCG-AAA382B04]|nr:hypothetical protein C9439_04820 [archaeon SCG-AAA382B04]
MKWMNFKDGYLKKNLEIKLEKLDIIKNPKPRYEQYPTPPGLAAALLNISLLQGNIKDKKVIDLGCGSGILSIGAALLGAKKVIGIDLDEDAIKVAKRNAKKFDLDIDWKNKDVKEVNEKADTVIQNPPFGSQSKGNDRPFIKKSLEISPVVYSLHKTETDDFIKEFVNQNGGKVDEKVEISFPIRRRFNFHKEKEKSVKVNIYKFVRVEND